MPAKLNRNLKALAADVAEGFVTVNPILLKSLTGEALKDLADVLERKQWDVRSQPVPFHDVVTIRKRNIRLQRLYAALMTLKNYAREHDIRIQKV